MITTLIFDMDGLLVDSEPWWRVAERNVFGRLSVEPTEEDFEKMMGNRIQEVIAKWHEKHPWENYSLEKTQQEIVEEVARLVTTNATTMPGVKELFAELETRNYKLALASSSPLYLINKLMSHFGLLNKFQVVHSAENEIQGKPHPAVFLSTAKMQNVLPENCLVFEDSFNGVLAAKAAGMKCVAVPAKEHFEQERFDIADLKIASLLSFRMDDIRC